MNVLLLFESATTHETLPLDPIFVSLEELKSSVSMTEFTDFLEHCLANRDSFTTFEWNDYNPEIIDRLAIEFNIETPSNLETWVRIIY